MFVWDDAWLATHTEAVVEPDLPIVDPHHHLWDHADMTRYLVRDLLADTRAGHRVEGTVFAECQWSYRPDGPEHLRPVGETERVVAETDPSFVLGIVGFADLTRGDAVDDVLAAHVEAGRGRFRGIRHATAFDPDRRVRRAHTRPPAGLLGDETFRAGARRLATRALSYDAWVYHPQLPEVAAFARALPELTVVLDHLGGPIGIGPYEGRRDEVLADWRRGLATVAACPNVVLKLGGIGMVTYGLGFEQRATPPGSDDLVAAWAGPITHAIEVFGADRCMFESNFPVDKMSCSYVVLWNTFKRIVAGASPSEKAALFAGTAHRAYRV